MVGAKVAILCSLTNRVYPPREDGCWKRHGQSRGISRVELDRRSGGDIEDSMRGRCPLNSVCGLEAPALILPYETPVREGPACAANHVVSALGARRNRRCRPLQTTVVPPAPARSGRGHSLRQRCFRDHGGPSRTRAPVCIRAMGAVCVLGGVQIWTVRQCPHLQCGQRARSIDATRRRNAWAVSMAGICGSGTCSAARACARRYALCRGASSP